MRNRMRVIGILAVCSWLAAIQGFQPMHQSTKLKRFRRQLGRLNALRTNVQMPLLNLLDQDSEDSKNGEKPIIPLPSYHLPPEVSTPFVYGMHVDRPLHKLLLEEATNAVANTDEPAIYGHLVWRDELSDSLVGAIGCTAQILVNAPSEMLNPSENDNILELMDNDSNNDSDSGDDSDESLTSNAVLCRGGYRFVIKEVVKTIPYPIVIVDEIEDDAEEGDNDMFAAFSNDDDDQDTDDEKYAAMSSAELLQKTMLGIQAVVSEKLEEATSKQTSPLEKQILESSGVTVDPNAIELLQAEEMVAVWEVFQACLVDEILPQDRKFAVAIMAAELADMNNKIRQEILLTRDGQERLQIVLKELDEMVGMSRARKLASQITDKMDDDSKDLKVGQPQLPAWARSIAKGTRVEYFWNEEYGWVSGRVIEDPVTVVDEILLTILFDDGETHTLPLSADEKVRWRPPEN